MLDYQHIKKLAADAGFDLCGLAPCGHMAQNEAWLRAWLGKGYQSSLTYMERNVEKRADPRKLVEGARTAVVCAVSYKNRIGEGYPPGHRTKIASYACTADYHTTIKGMLNGMLEHLKAADPGLGGRAFVDTAPLLEKQLAVEAGLGWIGRQSLLVTPRHGTYVLLGELLLTDEADAYDAPFEGSRCGRCRNCIESCPTGALVAVSRATPSNGSRPEESTSTAGSSAATAARAAVPTTRRRRCTPIGRSIPSSTR